MYICVCICSYHLPTPLLGLVTFWIQMFALTFSGWVTEQFTCLLESLVSPYIN